LEELLAAAEKKAPLVIPPQKELKKICLPAEFKRQNNPRPAAILVPVYKAKYFLGRIKRNISK
jgi:hypothetical protein